jgi:hypothetical protein
MGLDINRFEVIQVKFQDIDNHAIKKILGFDTAKVRYHNKNKTGGNFGTNYVYGKFNTPGYENYEINGQYDVQGNLIQLGIGPAYQIGYRMDPNNIHNLQELIEAFKMVIKSERKNQS